MAIYKGSSVVKNVYKGNTKIGKIYHGSTIVYTSLQYAVDQVVFESSTAGTYTVNLLDDRNYEVYCVGSGATGAISVSSMKKYYRTGGSGSAFVGIIHMTKGYISVTVGNPGGGTSQDGASSRIGSYVTAYGGSKGTTTNTGGTGGAAPTINATIISQSVNTAGYTGNYSNSSSISPTASPYGGYGIGIYNGTAGAGYVKIVAK